MKKKNFQIGALIIVLLLIAIALVFIFIRYEPSFSPTTEPKITDIVSNIKTNPSQYTIVIPNDASSNIISSTSDFASAFGEFQQTKKHSEIDKPTATKLIYLKIDSSLIEDSKAIYYKNKESLLIIAKNEAELTNILAKLANSISYQTEFSNTGTGFTNNIASSLKCSDNTLYESCSATKPKYCSITNFDGTVSLIDKADICGMPVSAKDPITITRTVDSQMKVGQEYNVELKVTIEEAGLTSLMITEIPSHGFELIRTSVDPDPFQISDETNDSETTGTFILWSKPSPANGKTYTYTYIIKPIIAGTENIALVLGVKRATGSEFRINKDNQKFKNTITITSPQTPSGGSGGDSTQPPTPPPAPVCNENWECTNWGSCENKQRTRTCIDKNNCKTTVSKPSLTESCVACTDTDKGIDISTAGTVTYQGTLYTDTCNSKTKKITEYSCSTDDKMQSKEDDCTICSSDGKSCQQQFVGCVPACSQEQECVIPEGSITGTCKTKTPKTNLYTQLSSIETNRNHGYKGVVGKFAATTDSMGMVDIAGKFKVSQTKSDDQYNLTNIQTNIIIVGGPCINTLAKELKNNNKFKYGCDDWPGGGDFAVAEFIPDAFGPGKNAIFIAGTHGNETRYMSQLLKQYKETDKESKFKAKNRVCVSTTPSNTRFCQDLGLTDNDNTLVFLIL